VTAHVADGTQEVHVGASTLFGYHWLPAFTRLLDHQFADLKMEVVLDATVDPIGALRQRQIDLAIVPTAPHVPSLEIISLFADEMVAILPTTHPMADRPFLDATDLVAEVYIGDTPTRELGREYERFFEPAGVLPKRIISVGTTETVINFVRADIGVTILTRWTAAPYLRRFPLRAVQLLQVGLPVQWSAAIRADEPPNSGARRLAHCLATFNFLDLSDL
jgi:LysR family transcriptional regulator for metE and metH